jgi:hypothetical protein
LHRLDDGDAEAERLAHLRQQRGIALPAMAEDEIVADDRLAQAEPADQHLADEILGAQRGEFEVEMKIVEQRDAEAGQQLGLDAKGRQAKRRGARLEDAARMRLEGEDGVRHVGNSRQLARLGNDELMAEMDAVEIADGDGAAARARRKPGIVAEDVHCSLDYRPAMRPGEENHGRSRGRAPLKGAAAPEPGPRRRSPPCRRRCTPS